MLLLFYSSGKVLFKIDHLSVIEHKVSEDVLFLLFTVQHNKCMVFLFQFPLPLLFAALSFKTSLLSNPIKEAGGIVWFSCG